VFEPGPLTVVTGGNGVGKSNVYRALELLHVAATGRLAETLARDGSIPSIAWAGPEDVRTPAAKRAGRKIEGTVRKRPIRVTVGVALAFAAYGPSLGLTPPVPGGTAFALDPEVKEEWLWQAPKRRPSNTWMSRDGVAARCLDRDGEWRLYPQLAASD